MTQEINYAEQKNQATFEGFETKKSESILSAFFNDCNEEEQKIINEFSQIQGIKANDAVWIFVKIFFRINRENTVLYQKVSDNFESKQNEIPEKFKEFIVSLIENETQKILSCFSDFSMKTLQDILKQHKKQALFNDCFIPIFCVCAGVFLLCLISFIAGSAVVGKGWGHSPFDALLNAPAGWIIPLALIPVGSLAFFRGLTEQGRDKYLNLIIAFMVGGLVLWIIIHIL
ncbi:MAG: hypothetical protein IJ859_09565 [Synergistaceae bacterium]|nr:hypothetical protein [Synergistaceae bacterium]